VDTHSRRVVVQFHNNIVSKETADPVYDPSATARRPRRFDVAAAPAKRRRRHPGRRRGHGDTARIRFEAAFKPNSTASLISKGYSHNTSSYLFYKGKSRSRLL